MFARLALEASHSQLLEQCEQQLEPTEASARAREGHASFSMSVAREAQLSSEVPRSPGPFCRPPALCHTESDVALSLALTSINVAPSAQ